MANCTAPHKLCRGSEIHVTNLEAKGWLRAYLSDRRRLVVQNLAGQDRARGDRASGGRCGRRGQSRCANRARERGRRRASLVSPARACRERGLARPASDFPIVGIDAVEDVQGDALCGSRVMLGDVCAQGDEIVNGFPETIGASYAPRRSALIACLPGSNPIADARVRDAFAAVERGERFGDAGDLPLIGVEVGGNRLGREERSAAAGALC